MTPIIFLLLAIAGGAGAAVRLLVDGLVKTRFGARFPWGTAVINVSGSFALGLVAGLTAAGRMAEAWELVVGAGFLGGYTTFSTASFETVRLLQERRFAAALLNGLGLLVLAVGAALVGYLLGSVH